MPNSSKMKAENKSVIDAIYNGAINDRDACHMAGVDLKKWTKRIRTNWSLELQRDQAYMDRMKKLLNESNNANEFLAVEGMSHGDKLRRQQEKITLGLRSRRL